MNYLCQRPRPSSSSSASSSSSTSSATSSPPRPSACGCSSSRSASASGSLGFKWGDTDCRAVAHPARRLREARGRAGRRASARTASADRGGHSSRVLHQPPALAALPRLPGRPGHERCCSRSRVHRPLHDRLRRRRERSTTAGDRRGCRRLARRRGGPRARRRDPGHRRQAPAQLGECALQPAAAAGCRPAPLGATRRQRRATGSGAAAGHRCHDAHRRHRHFAARAPRPDPAGHARRSHRLQEQRRRAGDRGDPDRLLLRHGGGARQGACRASRVPRVSRRAHHDAHADAARRQDRRRPENGLAQVRTGGRRLRRRARDLDADEGRFEPVERAAERPDVVAREPRRAGGHRARFGRRAAARRRAHAQHARHAEHAASAYSTCSRWRRSTAGTSRYSRPRA